MSAHGGVPAPNRAMVNITGRCNSRCCYCRAWWEGAKGADPTREELLDLLGQVARLGCKAVGFSGGEPLLRDDLEEVVACAVSHGLSVGLVTNGLLLTQRRMADLASSGLGSLSVSLDSLDPDVYQGIRRVPLGRALANLKAAASLGLMPMGISVTVSARNVGALGDLVAFSREYGLLVTFQLYEQRVHLANAEDSLQPTPGQLGAAVKELCALKREGAPITNSYEYLQSLPRYAQDGGWVGLERCLAPGQELCVDETMNVHTCWGLDEVVGSLRAQTLAEIWGSDSFGRLRRALRDCRRCILSCHFDNSLRLLATGRTPAPGGEA